MPGFQVLSLPPGDWASVPLLSWVSAESVRARQGSGDAAGGFALGERKAFVWWLWAAPARRDQRSAERLGGRPGWGSLPPAGRALGHEVGQISLDLGVNALSLAAA